MRKVHLTGRTKLMRQTRKSLQSNLMSNLMRNSVMNLVTEKNLIVQKRVVISMQISC